jgi:hypothetical protein
VEALLPRSGTGAVRRDALATAVLSRAWTRLAMGGGGAGLARSRPAGRLLPTVMPLARAARSSAWLPTALPVPVGAGVARRRLGEPGRLAGRGRLPGQGWAAWLARSTRLTAAGPTLVRPMTARLGPVGG